MRSSSPMTAPAFTVHVSVSPHAVPSEPAEAGGPARPDKSLLATLDDGLFDVRNAVGSLHDYVKLRALSEDADEFAHLDGACALIMARLGALLEAVEVAAHE